MAEGTTDSEIDFASPHPTDEILRQFVLGQLSDQEFSRIATHLEKCDTCLQHIQSVPTERLVTLIQQSFPPNDRQHFRHPIQKYRILEEIGRGGMAVVFRAEQIGLDRIVALKQIRADTITAEALTRFRTEAEVMARIQHPNMVQVYDVGEQQGLPYLACEYISGGSLDQRLNGDPLPVQVACQLTAAITRGIQAAHEHSIIHRDLKPSNVLLECKGNDRSLDGGNFWTYVNPKVGDFGLAKHLDHAQGHTHTGDVMGTPGYMAPEQASGLVEEIGRETDIFALGVILYELLTGRRPFRAASIPKTLELICTGEPLRPRQLQPTIPRDVEVICLKCLEKNPHRRYRSARELADDLDRWLDGKPILARPVTAWERAWKWGRRYPAAAALLITISLSVVAILFGTLWHNHRLAKEVRRANANQSAAVLEFSRGYEAMYELLKELMDEQVNTDIADTYRERLFGIIRGYHERSLEGTDETNPEVRFARASSQFFLGGLHEIQGEYDEALRLLVLAQRELVQLGPLLSDQTELRSRLAACNRRVALTRFRSTNVADQTTMDEMQQASDLLKDLNESHPQNLDFYRRRAGVCYERCAMYFSQGQLAQAEEMALQSLQIQESLRNQFPLRNLDCLLFEQTTSFLSRMLISSERFEEADQLLQHLELVFTRVLDEPHSPEVDVVLANLYDTKCQLELTRGRPEKALQHRFRSIEIVEQVLRDIPRHRAAVQFLARYETERDKLLTQLGKDANTNFVTGTNAHQDQLSQLATELSDIRSYRIAGKFDEAMRQLPMLEHRLQVLRQKSRSSELIKLIADTNFEWAELCIAMEHLETAIDRYDCCISLLNELVNESSGNDAIEGALSYCHRLKAWHLSRAGQLDEALPEWDRAILHAADSTRDYLCAERALEHARRSDYVRATVEADQVLTNSNLAADTLMHLARVYSLSLQALQNDVSVTPSERDTLTDQYSNQALRCFQHAIRERSSETSIAHEILTDDTFAALHELTAYQTWHKQTFQPDDDATKQVQNPTEPKNSSR